MTEHCQATAGGPLLQSLLILCRHHRRSVHPDALLTGLPLEQGFLTPALFDRAARRAQFSSRMAQVPLLHINRALLPAIALLNTNNACVITSLDVQSGTAEVIHPDLPDAVTQVSLTELQQQYSGYTLYARPEYQQRRDDNPFSLPRDGHWFWAVIRQNRSLYRDIILAAVVINIFAIATPMFVMNVYDRVVPNNAFSTLWMLAIGMLILLCADLTLKLLRSWFVDLAASRTDIRLSSRLLDQILAMQLQHRPGSTGSLAANLQSFESVRAFVSSLTLTALADLPFLLLFVVIISLISWPLVIPILLGSAAILLYALVSQHNMRALARQGMEAGAERNAILLEGLGNIETVKSFNLQSNIQSRWENLTIVLSHNAARMRLLSASVSQGAAWIQQAAGISILIIGVYQLSQGDLTQGGLIAAYLLSSRALAPVSQAAALLAQFHQASTAMEALDKLMELPPETGNQATQVNRPVLRGEIEFNKVSFAYPNSDLLALNQVSLKIRAGEHVAILGKNGSGKSTLEKLILGLYQPKEGSILIDGVDLRQLDPAQLRRNIGYVPQDVALLQGTLRQNITPDHNRHTDDEVLAITGMVGLTPMIHQHPQGLALPVGERGHQLSGGQKQAVALARALINDPPLLILDEPTASLDHASEEQIKKVLAEKAAGKTLLLITHRSSLLALAQRLIVIDQGKIVADGPKDIVMEALRQGRIAGAAS